MIMVKMDNATKKMILLKMQKFYLKKEIILVLKKFDRNMIFISINDTCNYLIEISLYHINYMCF